MVAVTTAAGQFGPRLIGNFMRDRANQVTLGMFISTFLYCIVVLRSVTAEISIDAQNTVGLTPSLSVLVALILTLISVGVLIFFVHHIPETLNVGNMTGKVSKALICQIEDGRFPGSAGLEVTDCGSLSDPFDHSLTQTVRSHRSGYVQGVALKAMMEWAEEKGCRVRLNKVPGVFVTTGDAVADIVSDDTHQDFDRKEFRETIEPKVMSFIAVGQKRTVHQNLLFLADELTEIAARALSPGVNDPFTAVNCIHWYGDICQSMMVAPDQPECVLDSSGTPRIWAKSVTLDRLCDTMFGQSRQYVCEDENAAREALETLYALKTRASTAQLKTIDRHIGALHTAISESGLGDAQKNRLRGGPPYQY